MATICFNPVTGRTDPITTTRTNPWARGHSGRPTNRLPGTMIGKRYIVVENGSLDDPDAQPAGAPDWIRRRRARPRPDPRREVTEVSDDEPIGGVIAS
jgi:hypothetical protein